jgi:hypothetical protein
MFISFICSGQRLFSEKAFTCIRCLPGERLEMLKEVQFPVVAGVFVFTIRQIRYLAIGKIDASDRYPYFIVIP